MVEEVVLGVVAVVPHLGELEADVCEDFFCCVGFEGGGVEGIGVETHVETIQPLLIWKDLCSVYRD